MRGLAEYFAASLVQEFKRHFNNYVPEAHLPTAIKAARLCKRPAKTLTNYSSVVTPLETWTWRIKFRHTSLVWGNFRANKMKRHRCAVPGNTRSYVLVDWSPDFPFSLHPDPIISAHCKVAITQSVPTQSCNRCNSNAYRRDISSSIPEQSEHKDMTASGQHITSCRTLTLTPL